MSKNATHPLHVQIANDLEELHNLISVSVQDDGGVVCRDARALMSAASQCRAPKDEKTWHYTTELVFDVPKVRRAYPPGLKNVTVRMLLDITGDSEGPVYPADPLRALTFELIIEGVAAKNTRHHGSWHLDRHPGSHTQSGGETPSEEEDDDPEDVHPRYHFHFGGKRMYSERQFFGPGVLLTTPRLAHPPLDAVLGVDFVLANFRGADWKALRENNLDYLRLQQRAQARFWTPYLRALGLCWSSVSIPPEHWPHSDPWPSLLPLPSPVAIPVEEQRDEAGDKRSSAKKGKAGDRRSSR